MGQLRRFISDLHTATQRNYAERACEEKPLYAEIAKRFDREYWDGSRQTGYGGYFDDGRWARVADEIVANYSLADACAVLDVGCGKGYFLDKILNVRPRASIQGLDPSKYALERAPERVRSSLLLGRAEDYPFQRDSFDLVVSINTLHNLELPALFLALANIQRTSRGNSYICVESYRNEREKWNLMRWQLTCEGFYTPREWLWIFSQAGYRGDYEFIFFE